MWLVVLCIRIYQPLCCSNLGIQTHTDICVCFYQWCLNYNNLHLLFPLFPNDTVVKYYNVWKRYFHQVFSPLFSVSAHFNPLVDFMYTRSFAPFSDYMLNKFFNAVVLSLFPRQAILTQTLSALVYINKNIFFYFYFSLFERCNWNSFCSLEKCIFCKIEGWIAPPQMTSAQTTVELKQDQMEPNEAGLCATNQLWKDIKGGLEVLTSPGSKHWFSAGSLQALHCGFRGAQFATDPVCEIEGERINNRVSTIGEGLRWQQILANKVETCQRGLQKKSSIIACVPSSNISEQKCNKILLCPEVKYILQLQSISANLSWPTLWPWLCCVWQWKKENEILKAEL